MAHKYSELPVEEQLEIELSETPLKRPAWRRIALLIFTPLLVVASLLLVLGIANAASGRPVLAQLTETPWFSHATRAPDGQFLLGVGKADITGYVRRCFSRLRLFVTNSVLVDPS